MKERDWTNGLRPLSPGTNAHVRNVLLKEPVNGAVKEKDNKKKVDKLRKGKRDW